MTIVIAVLPAPLLARLVRRNLEGAGPWTPLAIPTSIIEACLGPNPDEPVYGGLSRRQMLQFCAGIAATMGLSAAAGVRMAEAAIAPARPPVIWLHGQECTGCTESLLRSYHPTLEVAPSRCHLARLSRHAVRRRRKAGAAITSTR